VAIDRSLLANAKVYLRGGIARPVRYGEYEQRPGVWQVGDEISTYVPKTHGCLSKLRLAIAEVRKVREEMEGFFKTISETVRGGWASLRQIVHRLL
jgi:hypothetical protein